MKNIIQKIIAWVTKIFLNPWYVGFVIFALSAIICFFNVSGYWADKHHANGLLIIGGILLGLFALLCLYMTSKTSRGGGGGSSVK